MTVTGHDRRARQSQGPAEVDRAAPAPARRAQRGEDHGQRAQRQAEVRARGHQRGANERQRGRAAHHQLEARAASVEGVDPRGGQQQQQRAGQGPKTRLQRDEGQRQLPHDPAAAAEDRQQQEGRHATGGDHEHQPGEGASRHTQRLSARQGAGRDGPAEAEASEERAL